MRMFKLVDASGFLHLPFLFRTKREAEFAMRRIQHVWEENGYYDVDEIFEGHPDLYYCCEYFDGLADAMDQEEFTVIVTEIEV